MVALDVLYQGTVPVAKILPPLVIVRLSPESKVNAELGLVIARLLKLRVQTGKQGVGLMQRHGLALFQMGAFTPKHRNNRLRCRVKGWCFGFLRRCRDSVGLFRRLLKGFQLIAGESFRYSGLLFQNGKDFITGRQHGKIRIVKLASVQLLVIRAIQGIVIAGFGCLHIQGIAVFQPVSCFLFLRLFGFLFCLALLLKLGQMAVNVGYQLVGRLSDGFKGGFQFGQLPPGTPTGHIAKGIV